MAKKRPSGDVLIEALKKELGCANSNQLAIKLGIKLPQILAWAGKPLTATTAKNIIRRLDTRFVRNSFQGICEFQRLSSLQEGETNTLRNRINSDVLCKKLEDARGGIYTFYDSSGRLIYVGKTEKNSLMNEMGQQFTKRKVRIRKTDAKGNFHHEWVSLREFVEYCSAYAVHKSVIHDFEALIARIAPNNIANDQIPKYKK